MVEVAGCSFISCSFISCIDFVVAIGVIVFVVAVGVIVFGFCVHFFICGVVVVRIDGVVMDAGLVSGWIGDAACGAVGVGVGIGVVVGGVDAVVVGAIIGCAANFRIDGVIMDAGSVSGWIAGSAIARVESVVVIGDAAGGAVVGMVGGVCGVVVDAVSVRVVIRGHFLLFFFRVFGWWVDWGWCEEGCDFFVVDCGGWVVGGRVFALELGCRGGSVSGSRMVAAAAVGLFS